MFKIGNIETKNNVVLAPMAGVCNPAFRLIAKEFGVGLVCAEMVSDKAIVHKNERTCRCFMSMIVRSRLACKFLVEM